MRKQVAYLGPQGTFAEKAAHILSKLANFQTPIFVPCNGLHSVIKSIAFNNCDAAVVPIENSVEGGVTSTLDALWKFPDIFINQVLNNQTSLSSNNDFYRDVNSILERKERLTENNLIVGSSISISRNTQENFLDEDFSQLRIKLEMVGNIFNEVLRANNINSNGKVEISNILPSQYTKAEISYIKHLLLNKGDIIAFRAFSGVAIPYGNSDYIPFTRSYYAGGSNDNRAWKAYKLGPGSSNNINEFNEANFKIAFNLEYRSKISGKLNSAFFIDVGNIWNLNDNVNDSSMTFDSFSDLEELAIGSGVGLRYDLNFFVLRLDAGFKTYNPAREKSERWFNDFTLRKAVFNIGINYPF